MGQQGSRFTLALPNGSARESSGRKVAEYSEKHNYGNKSSVLP